jgi:putative peptidoglycan lipid II flippase
MPHHDQHHRTLSRGVRTIFSVTLVSRLAGLVRDVIMGRIFGDTAIGSAFLAAFQFPNLFRRLFGEGALSAAFIPAYTDSLNEPSDPRAADRLATLTLAILGVVTGLLTIVAELVLLILLVTLPANPDRGLSLRLIMVVLPYMPLICAAAILAGILQTHGRYAAASAGPVLLNAFVIVIGGYFLAVQRTADVAVAYILAVAIVLSGVTQCIWFMRLLRRHVRWTFDYAAAAPRARAMLRRFLPVAIGLGALQLNTFLDTVIAMYPIWVGPTLLGHDYPLHPGSNSIISLASRLYQFPLGVFGIAVATAVFPLLARTANDAPQFISTLRRGVRLSIFIGVPASIGLALIRRDITFVMFSGGHSGFTAAGAATAATVLLGHSAGNWAYSLNHVFARAFYARSDTRTPMKVALVAVLLNLILNLTLIWWLAEAGMAWATSIAAIVQCAILWLLLRRRLRDHEPIADRDTLVAGAKVLLASAIMGAAVYGSLKLVPDPLTWQEHFIALAVGVIVGGVVYAAATAALRMNELGWLIKGQ